MDAQATFRQSRISVGVALAMIALAAAFLLGGASGYFAKAWTAPASTSTQVITIPPATPQRTILPNQA